MRAMLAQPSGRVRARRSHVQRRRTAGHTAPCRGTCQTPGDNRTCVRFVGPVREPGRPGRKGRDRRMLSRRQRIWDEAIRELGIDPAMDREGRGSGRRDHQLDAHRAVPGGPGQSLRGRRGVGLGGVRSSGRGLLRRRRAARALGGQRLLRAPRRARESPCDARAGMGRARATPPAGSPPAFAARLLRRLSGVYERLRMKDRPPRRRRARAVIAELSPDGPPAPARRCA